MKQPFDRAGKAQPAFTLVELLVVIGVLALCFAMLAPALAKTRHNTKDRPCLHNLRQLAAASQMYAQDNNGHLLPDTIGTPPNTWTSGRDDLSWCYPNYIRRLKTFVCPATANNVRTNTVFLFSIMQRLIWDLMDNARGGASGTNGHSYEVLGQIRGMKFTQSFVQSYTLQFHPTLKGTQPGPAAFWIFHDADDSTPNVIWDKGDNHGAAGGNVAYCDGHVAWVSSEERTVQWPISRDLNTPLFPK